MKIFKVSASGYSFEDCISIIVVAENEEKAIGIAKEGRPYDWNAPNQNGIYWEFSEEQYPLLVEEIDLQKEKVVLSEYYGN